MILYFDDLEIGQTHRFGTYQVTREEVIDFAGKYDPQPFHLSDEAAASTLFGKIAASGWHTAAMTMRLVVEHWQAIGLDKSCLGGIGSDEVRWLRPVYPGDTLTLQAEVVEKIPSRSKDDRGIIRARWTTLNQNDKPVMTQIGIGIFRRRPA